MTESEVEPVIVSLLLGAVVVVDSVDYSDWKKFSTGIKVTVSCETLLPACIDLKEKVTPETAFFFHYH